VRHHLNAPSASESDVVEVLAALEAAGASAWLVGGWATDALLGCHTRPHDDIDVVVEAEHAAAAREALERQGFRFVHEVPAGRWLGLQIKMVDRLRRFVSLHPVDVGSWSQPGGAASIAQGARELGIAPPGALFATGVLARRDVPVLAPATQLVLRCGYEIRECDRRDVAALCSRFALVPPSPYAVGDGGGAARSAAP
jgi:lincosamide nucleotidyltransferase A/C/D/E